VIAQLVLSLAADVTALTQVLDDSSDTTLRLEAFLRVARLAVFPLGTTDDDGKAA
jgi:hypothetical protein